MQQQGQLHQKNGKWVVKYNQIVHTQVGTHDYRVSLQDAYLPIHPEHKLWVIMFAEEGRIVNFEVQTIAEGTSEFDVMDTDVAKFI
jgi:hypothetical protein